MKKSFLSCLIVSTLVLFSVNLSIAATSGEYGVCVLPESCQAPSTEIDRFLCESITGQYPVTINLKTGGEIYGPICNFDEIAVVIISQDIQTLVYKYDIESTDYSSTTSQEVEVAPLSHNLGEVLLNTSSIAIVDIQNVGDSDLILKRIDWVSPTSGAFFQSLTTGCDSLYNNGTLPCIIAPGESVSREITFSPQNAIPYLDVLEIETNDVDEHIIQVSFNGTGVTEERPNEITIADLIGGINDAVTDDTLVGLGEGRSADNRLNALKNMLDAASDLIDAGETEEACGQLQAAHRKTDGDDTPPDFVEGSYAPDLAIDIYNYMVSHGCDGFGDCIPGNTESCYTGPEGTLYVGLCAEGQRVCQNDGLWGDCQEQILPSIELYDLADNDCDGQVDEGLYAWYADVDEDGYGDSASYAMATNAPLGYVADNSDCNDANTTIHPGVADPCDGVDNDCDVLIDEDYQSIATSCGTGACGAVGVTSCVNGGVVDNCTPNPPVTEICNDIDDDCDGLVDEDLSIDADFDLHYAEGSCLAPADDCDDSNAMVNPDIGEVADDIDNNCDGVVDNITTDTCLDCHSQELANSFTRIRNVAIDFTLGSHHAQSGEVSSYDCVMCHLEGNAEVQTTELHGNRAVNLRDADGINLDGWEYFKPLSVVNTSNGLPVTPDCSNPNSRTSLSLFCQSCHDADGFSDGFLNAVAANEQYFTGETSARAPNDPFASGIPPLDVVSQFKPENASTHSLSCINQSGNITSGYKPGHSKPMPAEAWNEGWSDDATTECADCHLPNLVDYGGVVYENAHGGSNVKLLDDEWGGGQEIYAAENLPCFKCHNRDAIESSTATRFGLHIQSMGSGWYAQGSDSLISTETGISCFVCHAGVGYGSIHGITTEKCEEGGVLSTTAPECSIFINGAQVSGWEIYIGDGSIMQARPADTWNNFTDAGQHNYYKIYDWSTNMTFHGDPSPDFPTQPTK